MSQTIRHNLVKSAAMLLVCASVFTLLLRLRISAAILPALYVLSAFIIAYITVSYIFAIIYAALHGVRLGGSERPTSKAIVGVHGGEITCYNKKTGGAALGFLPPLTGEVV